MKIIFRALPDMPAEQQAASLGEAVPPQVACCRIDPLFGLECRRVAGHIGVHRRLTGMFDPQTGKINDPAVCEWQDTPTAGTVHLDVEPDGSKRYVVLTCPTCGEEKSGEARQAVTLGCAVVDMANHIQTCPGLAPVTSAPYPSAVDRG